MEKRITFGAYVVPFLQQLDKGARAYVPLPNGYGVSILGFGLGYSNDEGTLFEASIVAPDGAALGQTFTDSMAEPLGWATAEKVAELIEYASR